VDEGLTFICGVLVGVVLAFLAIFRMIAEMHADSERLVRLSYRRSRFFTLTGPHPEETIMEPILTQLIELAVAFIMAVVAYWQNRQKDQVVAFFDPANESVTTPLSSVPSRSWEMDDAPKMWLCAGDPLEEQASLLQQVADAEAEQKSSYVISVPSGFMRSGMG
jgi:hypothetical protein